MALVSPLHGGASWGGSLWLVCGGARCDAEVQVLRLLELPDSELDSTAELLLGNLVGNEAARRGRPEG